MAKKTEPTCFVVCAIGGAESPHRLHADWVLEEIIEPVFEAQFPDYKVLRADRMSSPGLIDAQVIDRLLNAELVIADLTFLNPNAFYEIGIRHMAAKPIIHIHKNGESIPFDISLFRSMPFDVSAPKLLKAARAGLKDLVTAALDKDHVVENPVTKARGVVAFDQSASSTEVVLRDGLEAMATRLTKLEHRLNRSHHDTSEIRVIPARAKSLFYGGGEPIPIAQKLVVQLGYQLDAGQTSDALLKFADEIVVPMFGDVTLTEDNRTNIVLQFNRDNVTDAKWRAVEQRAAKDGLLLTRL